MLHSWVFKQRPFDHIKGSGCPSCGGTKKSTLEEFILKSKLVQINIIEEIIKEIFTSL